MKLIGSFAIVVFVMVVSFCSMAQNPETVFPSYTGSRAINEQKLDGGIPWAIGVHSYGVFRAFKHNGQAHDKEGLGYQFNHHPDIVFWKKRYWVSYQGGPTDGAQGDKPPVPYFISHSSDGRSWEAPELLFPAIKFKGEFTYMHSRMGFHVSSSGKLLAISFHGRHKSPNGGGDNGVARVVREIVGIEKNGRVKMGPVYAIRFNHAKTAEDTGLDFYTSASDSEFIKACDELVNNKLVTQQWFEEDRRADLYTANMKTTNDGPNAEAKNTECKAFNWYTLPSGRIVGWWKGAAMAYSDDGWKTVSNINIDYDRLGEHRTAKMWGEKLSSGHYAMVFCLNTRPHNPKTDFSSARSPLVVMSSSDGLSYNSDRSVVFGDIPPGRYVNPPLVGGLNDNRDGGAQYVRGISESNKNKPNTAEPSGDMWLTYSVNKEDIWVSQVPKQVRYSEDKSINDNFQQYSSKNLFGDWIVISPAWAPITLAKEKRNLFMRLQDQDPYEYAKAMRVFPASNRVVVRFSMRCAVVSKGNLQIDITDKSGNVAVRLEIDHKNGLSLLRKDTAIVSQPIQSAKWFNVQIDIDSGKQEYRIAIDGKEIPGSIPFMQTVGSVERLEIRTGQYRMNDFSRVGMWKAYPEYSFPDADEKLPASVFDLDNLTIDRH